MIYLGSLGRMIPVACPSEQRQQVSGRYVFQETLEGNVKAQVRPVGRRVWDLRLPSTSTQADVATLEAFVEGYWGIGPFRFLPVDAPVTNLLPPTVAACDESENPSGVIGEGGPVQVDGLWFPKSYFNPNPSLVTFFGRTYESGAVPVVSGEPVTGSVFVSGSNSRVRLTFYDRNEVSVGSFEGAPHESGSSLRRSSVTVMPPPDAVAARIYAISAVRATGPAITWTDEPVEWGSGQGCLKAVVHDASRDIVLALPRRTYMGIGFSVQEIG